eukprot:CAMPEP_0182433066 /NCGR_PEP_ID=MMETSP1167-20130531/60613_1 /TAXON_ID=2988 /ORGANISM="Mallomonas Sp, Strain CCMP3275" /LENGTH=52 /DNA_ID=CAMNT_0024621277 /DNA_START=196 /DNA_END=354 /DNA_ORIENTATION=+
MTETEDKPGDGGVIRACRIILCIVDMTALSCSNDVLPVMMTESGANLCGGVL